MKITKNNNKKTNSRLLISELINFKMYRIKVKNHLNHSLLATNIFSYLKQTSFNFKKMLQIIFQYHFNKKKILVIGEKPLIKKQVFYIHKKTDHVFISETAWINGLLSNNKTIEKFIKKKNPMLKLVKRPQLIVLYNYWNLIDTESYKRRITSVTLTNTYLEPKYRYNKSPTYSAAGNLTEIRKKQIQFFFSTLIEKIIKIPKLNLRYYYYNRASFLSKKKRKNKKMSKKSYYDKKQTKHNKKKLLIYDFKNNPKKI